MLSTLLDPLGRFGPYTVVAAFQAVIFGLYAKTLSPFGAIGILLAALIGAFWALLLGVVAEHLARRPDWRRTLANAPLSLGITAMALMIGGGAMYIGMMREALAEPSTTYAVLAALMQPAVPFYIILNSAMELFLVALILFWNWRAGDTRRALVLFAAVAYLLMRVWTYLVYAEARLDLSQSPLSPEDVAWFESTLAADFRIVLNVITYVCLLLAAFRPVVPNPTPMPDALYQPDPASSRLVPRT